MAVNDSWSQLPGYKKKKKKVPGLYQPPGLNKAPSRPIPQKPLKAPPAVSQAPRFPTPIPQRVVKQPPPSAIYGMNLKNLSQAYFEKYSTFPNAVQTYFMLENSGGQLWAKDEWGKVLGPGKAAPSPIFNEFEKVLKGPASGEATMGLGTTAPPEDTTPQVRYPGYYSGDVKVSDESQSAFSINEADPKMIGRKVAPPDFAAIPLMLAARRNQFAVDIGGMDPAQLEAYDPKADNQIEWKRYWAGVMKDRGEKVPFDPESTDWNNALSKQYARYLWYRVVPYAMLSQNQSIKQAALKALGATQPELLGSYSLDPNGTTPLKFKTALANVSDIVGAMTDENKKAFYFNSFSAGRTPGDSDRKVLYDYVAEFGQNNLPADKIAEYRESLWTLNKIMSYPFEEATKGVRSFGEATDFAFDWLKQKPGAWGTVGEVMHTAYNKGLIELDPYTSSVIPRAISYGHQAGGAILDLFHDEMMQNVSLPGYMKKDSYQARAEERARQDTSMEVSTSYGMVNLHEWIDRLDQHAGKDAFVDLADDYLNDQGIPQDDWTRQAFRDVATVASLYITLKVAGKSDAFIRGLAIAQARKGFGALRFGEDVLKRREWSDQSGYIDLGPQSDIPLEPWQMTRKEYAAETLATSGSKLSAADVTAVANAAHPAQVKDAIAAGKPVPRAVLEEYAKHNQWAKKALAEQTPRSENLMNAPDRMFAADEFIGEGQQAGLDMGIDQTATKGKYEAPPQRPQEMPGQTGLDVAVPEGKPHIGRLEVNPDILDMPDEWLSPEELAAKRAAGPAEAVAPMSIDEQLAELDRRHSELSDKIDSVDAGGNIDEPVTDADFIAAIRDKGGILSTSRDAQSYWDSNLSWRENQNAFRNLRDDSPGNWNKKGAGVPMDVLAEQLNMDTQQLWDRIQQIDTSTGEGKRELIAERKAIESEMTRLEAERGAPQRTLTPSEGAPSGTTAGGPQEATAAPSVSRPVSSGPPVRTGVAPSNEYQGTLQTPEAPLGIPRTPEGTYPDRSLEIADAKRRLAEGGTSPDTGPPVRTGLGGSNEYQATLGESTPPFGIPRTPADGGPLGQQPLDTVAAGEVPPVVTPPPPVKFSNGLPPTHPQYWHVKALMTVSEYIARWANEDSAPLIRRMLNLEDEAALPEELRSGVKDAVKRMQATHDPEVVLSVLADLERKGVDTIDALGPAFFRAGKARMFENAFAAAEKMGPLGEPVAKAVRLLGTPIHLNRQIPFRDADYHVRNLGIAFKMGRKKMGAADMDELRSFEQQMFEADTKLTRDDVLHKFEDRVVENMKAEGTWDGPKGYQAFERSILDARSKWIRGTLGSPRKEVYGSKSTVTDTYAQMHAELKDYRDKAASYKEAGDEAKAKFWEDLANSGETRLNEMQSAGHIYTDEAKNPGKYRLKNKKGEQVEGNGPDGYAMTEEYNKAVQFLHDMGDEQPVWAWQLKQKLTLDKLDPRFLSWYQSGKGWQGFMKYDTMLAEPLIRQWKQWTLAGTGFPIRVFAGDEYWRMPMEGINPLSRAGRAEVARMRGDLSRKERNRMESLGEKDRAKQTSEAEKAELAGLKEKARPKVNEDILSLISKEGGGLDADVLNVLNDYWQLLGPTNKGTDPSGKVIWDVPDDPRYLLRVQRDIGLFSEEPVIKMLMQGKGWTKETASQAIRVLLIDDSEAGQATRDFLRQTGRIENGQMDRVALQKTMLTPSSGAYRNISNIIDEWTGMFLRIDASPEMREGLKNGYISLEDLKRVAENDPGALPTVPVGTFDKGMKSGVAHYFNLGPNIYNRVTLPMMTMIGNHVKDTLFGHEYLRQMELLRKRMPDADETVLMDQAAGRAANFVEKTTYTRDATIFEDMVRNHLLFINSYRQFWQYWLTKMVTHPVTMSTLWTMAPQKDDPGISGAFARNFSSLMPFFLQSRVSGDQRNLTPLAEAGAIAQPPGFGPVESLWMGAAIRRELGTDPGLLPGQASMGSSLLPGNRFGLLTEGLFNLNLPYISKDDLTSHGMLTAYEKETVNAEDYAGGVGDKSLRSNLPMPLSAMVWIRDEVNKHGFDWMKDRVFGNPIAFEQLVSSLTGIPSSLMVQTPPIYKAYTAERIKYSDLMLSGKPVEAAKYLTGTKYAQYVDLMKSTTSVPEKMQLLTDHPGLAALGDSVYTYDTGGSLMYDDSWVRQNKPEDVAMNDLREVLRKQYGGYQYDPATNSYLDTDKGSYPGDIARATEMPVVKQHMKDIKEVAKLAARDYATSYGVFNKKLYDDAMGDWKRRTDTYAAMNKWDKEPDAPDWYRDYINKHKAALSQNLPPGYTVHAWWHPKVYAEKVAGLWKSDYQSRNWKPTEPQAKAILHMSELGLFDPATKAVYLGKDSATGRAVAKVGEGLTSDWRKAVVDVNKAAFYDLDQTSLNRIGYHFGPEINAAIRKVRRAYYDWTGIVGTKAADGDTITYSSREYRDGRLKFYAYKDKVFGAVKGGEAFVGGVPERIMHTSFLTGKTMGFTGEDAVADTKLWKLYNAEAVKLKPNMKVIRELKTHFDGQLRERVSAMQAANDWVAVCATAKSLRGVMKTSYSDYYQGPGNSEYSNYGQLMVKKLEQLIAHLSQTDGKPNAFARDIIDYGFGDAHTLANSMLEWYYH